MEYSGTIHKDGPTEQVLHHGFLYKVSPLNQLDLHYGIGMNRAAPDFFIAAGYTFRIDPDFWKGIAKGKV